MRPLRRRGGRHPIMGRARGRAVVRTDARRPGGRENRCSTATCASSSSPRSATNWRPISCTWRIALYFERQSLERLGQALPRPGDRGSPARPEDHGLPDRQRGRVRPAGAQGRRRPGSVRRWPRRSGRSSPSRTSPPSSTRWPPSRRRPATTAGYQFLQWFIEEQVEEEAKLQRSSTSSTAASTCSRPRPCSTSSSELDAGRPSH